MGSWWDKLTDEQKEEWRSRQRSLQLGRKFTLEHRAKLSEAAKRWKRPSSIGEAVRRSRLGQKASKETLEKLRACNIGRTPSPEARMKISAARLKLFSSMTPEDRVAYMQPALESRRKSPRFPRGETSIERKVREQLSQRGIPFVQEFLVVVCRTCYWCDFFIPSMNLCIECDGEYYHASDHQKRVDERKTSRLEKCGMTVVRLTEKEILSDVGSAIDRALR